MIDGGPQWAHFGLITQKCLNEILRFEILLLLCCCLFHSKVVLRNFLVDKGHYLRQIGSVLSGLIQLSIAGKCNEIVM